MADKQKLIIDTSVFMEDLDLVKELIYDYSVYIPYVVLQELDNLKMSDSSTRSYKARSAARFINSNKDSLSFIETTRTKDTINDDLIIETAKLNKCSLATNDIYMQTKATAMSVGLVDMSVDNNEYKGYKELCTDNEDNNRIIADIYNDKTNNALGLLINEYLLIKNSNGTTVDKMR